MPDRHHGSPERTHDGIVLRCSQFRRTHLAARMRWRVQSRWPLASVQAQLYYGGRNTSFEDVFANVIGGSKSMLLAVSPLLQPTVTSWAFEYALLAIGYHACMPVSALLSRRRQWRRVPSVALFCVAQAFEESQQACARSSILEMMTYC